MAISHHIETIRSKPEHVRERIALGTSAGVTGLVGLIWVATLAATGTFSLHSTNTTLADNTATTVSTVAAETQTNFSQLVGGVGAALGATSTEPALRIVDEGSSSSLDSKDVAAKNNSNATVIPF
ncbi:MAG: hypothetical protein AB203_00020 [Parcubacteria bacterium C7867-008]|nr:MAG: hypothetical protein AB203_00020 [Parcubacteria bacterium C7867-008]